MTSPAAAAGPDGWKPPPDATPDRTAIVLARWQRRRLSRALIGLPLNEVGPRDGVGAAVIGGILLGVVLRVVALTVGALP